MVNPKLSTCGLYMFLINKHADLNKVPGSLKNHVCNELQEINTGHLNLIPGVCNRLGEHQTSLYLPCVN